MKKQGERGVVCFHETNCAKTRTKKRESEIHPKKLCIDAGPGEEGIYTFVCVTRHCMMRQSNTIISYIATLYEQGLVNSHEMPSTNSVIPLIVISKIANAMMVATANTTMLTLPHRFTATPTPV